MDRSARSDTFIEKIEAFVQDYISGICDKKLLGARPYNSKKAEVTEVAVDNDFMSVVSKYDDLLNKFAACQA